MAWTYNSIRIFVQDSSEDDNQIIAQLNPLNGGTINHIFGYEDAVLKLNAIIVGDTDKTGIIALTRSGDPYELIGPEGDMGDYYLSKASFKRIQCICQSIRTDLPEDSPVYNVSLELYKDE